MITIPHNFSPREYQLPFLKAMDSGKKRAVLIWHRRSGKDKTVLNFTIKKMLERVGAYYYFFPSYAQGKKILWDGADKDGFKFLHHFPKEILDGKPNDSEMKIKLKNGSLFQIIGTDNYDSIVGTNPIGCVFSEYSLQDPNAWEYLRPILRENGGWAVFCYTPRGMNHGAKMLQVGKDNEEEWFTQVLTADDTQAISKEDIEKERKEGMPDDLIQQEFYCKFLDGAGQYFRRILENTYTEIPEIVHNHNYQLGVDLAKYQDWTVLTPFDRNTFQVYPQERFNQIDWNLQKARVSSLARKHNNAQIVIDSTGVGDPITEDLQREDIGVVPFKFTEQSKRQLLNNLALLLEQDRIKIPKDEGLISELQSMRFELSSTGKIKVTVPSGMTDDRIMSLALSVWEVGVPPVIKNGELEETNDFGLYITSYQ